jgi:hypothetical protein
MANDGAALPLSNNNQDYQWNQVEEDDHHFIEGNPTVVHSIKRFNRYVENLARESICPVVDKHG